MIRLLLALLLVLPLVACGEEEPAPPTPTPAAPPAETPDRVAIRHILVSYQDARGAPFGTRRTRREARRRAEELLERIRAGEDFAELARRYSDDHASRVRGGFLGSGERGTWDPAFEAVAFSLAEGEVSGVVETPFGFHILRREPLEEVHLQHLVVQYKGAGRVPPESPARQRTRQQARERARRALEELQAGEPFPEVAARWSDGPNGKRGADLGWFLRGEVGPPFDPLVFELEPGEVSGIVETRFGFHVVRRVE